MRLDKEIIQFILVDTETDKNYLSEKHSIIELITYYSSRQDIIDKVVTANSLSGDARDTLEIIDWGLAHGVAE
jgi:hypothetical protein